MKKALLRTLAVLLLLLLLVPLAGCSFGYDERAYTSGSGEGGGRE